VVFLASHEFHRRWAEKMGLNPAISSEVDRIVDGFDRKALKEIVKSADVSCEFESVVKILHDVGQRMRSLTDVEKRILSAMVKFVGKKYGEEGVKALLLHHVLDILHLKVKPLEDVYSAIYDLRYKIKVISDVDFILSRIAEISSIEQSIVREVIGFLSRNFEVLFLAIKREAPTPPLSKILSGLSPIYRSIKVQYELKGGYAFSLWQKMVEKTLEVFKKKKSLNDALKSAEEYGVELARQLSEVQKTRKSIASLF